MTSSDFLGQIDVFLKNPDISPMPKVFEDLYTREQIVNYTTNDIIYNRTYYLETTCKERQQHEDKLRALAQINSRTKSVESLQNLYKYMIEIGGRGISRPTALITRYNFNKFMKNTNNDKSRKILTELYEDLFPGEIRIW
jgi:hypothetical protein